MRSVKIIKWDEENQRYIMELGKLIVSQVEAQQIDAARKNEQDEKREVLTDYMELGTYAVTEEFISNLYNLLDKPESFSAETIEVDSLHSDEVLTDHIEIGDYVINDDILSTIINLPETLSVGALTATTINTGSLKATSANITSISCSSVSFDGITLDKTILTSLMNGSSGSGSGSGSSSGGGNTAYYVSLTTDNAYISNSINFSDNSGSIQVGSAPVITIAKDDEDNIITTTINGNLTAHNATVSELTSTVIHVGSVTLNESNLTALLDGSGSSSGGSSGSSVTYVNVTTDKAYVNDSLCFTADTGSISLGNAPIIVFEKDTEEDTITATFKRDVIASKADVSTLTADRANIAELTANSISCNNVKVSQHGIISLNNKTAIELTYGSPRDGWTEMNILDVDGYVSSLCILSEEAITSSLETDYLTVKQLLIVDGEEISGGTLTHLIGLLNTPETFSASTLTATSANLTNITCSQITLGNNTLDAAKLATLLHDPTSASFSAVSSSFVLVSDVIRFTGSAGNIQLGENNNVIGIYKENDTSIVSISGKLRAGKAEIPSIICGTLDFGNGVTLDSTQVSNLLSGNAGSGSSGSGTSSGSGSSSGSGTSGDQITSLSFTTNSGSVLLGTTPVISMERNVDSGKITTSVPNGTLLSSDAIMQNLTSNYLNVNSYIQFPSDVNILQGNSTLLHANRDEDNNLKTEIFGTLSVKTGIDTPEITCPKINVGVKNDSITLDKAALSRVLNGQSQMNGDVVVSSLTSEGVVRGGTLSGNTINGINATITTSLSARNITTTSLNTSSVTTKTMTIGTFDYMDEVVHDHGDVILYGVIKQDNAELLKYCKNESNEGVLIAKNIDTANLNASKAIHTTAIRTSTADVDSLKAGVVTLENTQVYVNNSMVDGSHLTIDDIEVVKCYKDANNKGNVQTDYIVANQSIEAKQASFRNLTAGVATIENDGQFINTVSIGNKEIFRYFLNANSKGAIHTDNLDAEQTNSSYISTQTLALGSTVLTHSYMQDLNTRIEQCVTKEKLPNNISNLYRQVLTKQAPADVEATYEVCLPIGCMGLFLVQNNTDQRAHIGYVIELGSGGSNPNFEMRPCHLGASNDSSTLKQLRLTEHEDTILCAGKWQLLTECGLGKNVCLCLRIA